MGQAVQRFEDDDEGTLDGPELPLSKPRPGRLRRAISSAKRGFEALADVIMPPVCRGCSVHVADHDVLCPSCWSKVDFIRAPLCDRLGIPLPFDTGGTMVSAAATLHPPTYDRARAVASYTGLTRDLVHGLKFNDRHDMRRLLSRWLSEAGRELIADAEVIVPVPLSRSRLLRRHFNQAALLAQDIARGTHLEYAPLALVRIKKTRQQVGLTRRERQLNVAGAFRVPEAYLSVVRGRHVLLIDDVITTGATVGACAKALKRAGARRVDVLAVALVTDKGAEIG
jgi:ComF family protein